MHPYAAHESRQRQSEDHAAALEAAAERVFERLIRLPLADAIRAVPGPLGDQIEALFQRAYVEMAPAELAEARLQGDEDRAADLWDRRH